MQIYLLRNVGPMDWDMTEGLVIRAPDEQTARSLASTKAGVEGAAAWLDASHTSCEVIDANGNAGVILRSFNAG